MTHITSDSSNVFGPSADSPLADSLCLPSAEQQRFERLLERTFGRGFKLVVLETPTPRDRQVLMKWVADRLTSREAGIHYVDLVELLGQKADLSPRTINVWGELTRKIPPNSITPQHSAIMVWGAEDLMYDGWSDRSDLLQQFNVQRDLFVRDYPCWWILLIHPASRQRWKSVAPDFCDFVALWIETAEYGRSSLQSELSGEFSSEPGGQSVAGLERWPSELQAVSHEILLSRYDAAVDGIHSYRTAGSEHPGEWQLGIADLLEGDVAFLRGDPDLALSFYQDRALPVFERLRTVYELAQAHGRVADVLQLRGRVQDALEKRMREELPRLEQQGDVQSVAITKGKIAELLVYCGRLDDAMELLAKDVVPVFQSIGDKRSYAVSMGKIADVLELRGELDEALRIRKKVELPVYEECGCVRERAAVLSKIADIHQVRGELEIAMEIRTNEVMPVLVQLGETRAKTVELGKIADIFFARGELDAALRIYESVQLPEYRARGYSRLEGVALGKVGDIHASRGNWSGAIEAYRHSLSLVEQTGAKRDIVVAKANLAIAFRQRNFGADCRRANELLTEALTLSEEMQIPEANQIRELLRNGM